MPTDKPNVPERIELPNGYFILVRSMEIFLEGADAGKPLCLGEWGANLESARAFAAAMSPAGCGAELREAYKIADNIRCLQTAGRTGREVADQICTELKALAATPAPSVQASGQTRSLLEASAPKLEASRVMSLDELGQQILANNPKPKASAPSAVAGDITDTVIRQVLERHWPKKPGWRVTPEMVAEARPILIGAIATALREAELRGASKMQEAAAKLCKEERKAIKTVLISEGCLSCWYAIRALSPETVVEGV